MSKLKKKAKGPKLKVDVPNVDALKSEELKLNQRIQGLEWRNSSLEDRLNNAVIELQTIHKDPIRFVVNWSKTQAKLKWANRKHLKGQSEAFMKKRWTRQYEWFKETKHQTQVAIRRRCYRVKLKKAAWESPMTTILRVFLDLTPLWWAKNLGYGPMTKGFYGHPGEWRRLYGFKSEGPISESLAKYLTAIYNKTQQERHVVK